MFVYFQGVTLLKFLQVYKRISPLDEVEIIKWKSLYPMVRLLPFIAVMNLLYCKNRNIYIKTNVFSLKLQDTKPPAIANKRLPFHCLLQEDHHKIISK